MINWWHDWVVTPVPPEYSIALILLAIFGNRRAYKQGLKPPNNPTHPTTRRQADCPRPFHPTTAVKYVRFVGYNQSFLPPLHPILFPQRKTYLPANFEGVSYRCHPAHPVPCPSYQLLAPERQSVENLAQGHYPTHALANMPTSGP
jgi:hypothetical protein